MQARRRRAFAVVLFALAANVALIALPTCLFGRPEALATWPAICFLFAAECLLVADASTLHVGAEDDAATNAVDRRQQLLAAMTGLLLAGSLATGLVEYSRLPPLEFPAAISRLLFGLTLMLGGCILRWQAIRQLRRQFSSNAMVVGPQRQLVQGGIYRLIRHPSETGLLLVTLGAALLLGSTTILIGSGALFLISLWRIRWEDEQLAVAWGESFAAYRRRVPALIPIRIR